MRLLSAHIENFGKLHDLSLSFTDGLNVIERPNGWGKSTLAAFLRAMFYGLPDSRRKNAPDERRLYAPWQGGAFGGSLVFSAEGHTYRVLRTFGSRAREDTFFFYDAETGLPSGAHSSQLGQELFGVDAPSFTRSVYMPQLLSGGADSSAPAGSNAGSASSLRTFGPAAPDIRARITDLSGEDEQLRSCDAARTQLRREADALSPDRRTGAVRRAQEDLSRLQAEALHIPALESTVQELLQQSSACASRLRELQEEQDILRSRSEDLGRSLEASRILQDRRLAESSCALAEEELARIQSQAAGIEAQIRNLQAQQAEKPAPDVPPEYSERLEGLLADRRSARESLRRTGRKGTALQKKLREDLQTLKNVQSAPETAPDSRGSFGSPLLLPAVVLLSALLLFVSLYLFTSGSSPLPALLLLLSGLLCAAAAWRMRRVQGNTAQVPPVEEAEQHRIQLEQQIGRERRQLHALRLRAESLRAGIEAQTAEIEALQKQMQQYRQVQADGSGYDPLSAQIGTLTAQRRDLASAEQAARDRLAAAEAARSRCMGGGASMGSSSEEDALLETAALAEDEELSLPELSAEILRVQREQEVLQSSADEYSSALEDAQQRLEQCIQCREEASALETRIEEMKTRHRLLTAAEACLSDAAASYSRQYVLPFLDTFEDYYDLLGGDPVVFHGDSDLGITAEAEGQPRALTSFSAGSRDLMEICRHLALCRCMYRGEQPFLILDDPFVNLDEARIAAALPLLERLAERQQILYLTCHGSRVP